MNRLVQVAVPSPLYGLFDYQWKQGEEIIPGTRVSVPFGRRSIVGIIVGEIQKTEVPSNKLRSVYKVLDSTPAISADLLSLLQWASRYYHHPLGEVLSTALPVALRQGKPAQLAEQECFRWLPESTADKPTIKKSAAVQQRLLEYLQQRAGQVATAAALRQISPRWRVSLKPLIERGFVSAETYTDIPANTATGDKPELLDEQAVAVAAIQKSLGLFKGFLLNGVTGSGKTEVYLRCIEAAVSQGLQALVLVPEISLTPQLMSRFEQRLTGCLVSLHSGLNDSERLQNWLYASQGHADVVIGTRSSILAPLPRLGLIIVDEEHDGSLKQQDGFRYHARDLALMRARDCACPIVLGTATPSFESLNNAKSGRIEELLLTQRAGEAVPPTLSLLDIRRRKLLEGMSDRLIDQIRSHLDADGQALIFINRRGFAPTLLCNDCGAAANCRRCDAHMTVHVRSGQLRCHHCGSERRLPDACDECASLNLDRVGYGTERISDALMEIFPDVPLARIDRDSTRRKGALEEQLEKAVSGDARLLVGTQMLAKGHHFPKLTLVCILDADRGLFGTDFRSLEHMAQLILQVAGRAGREAKKGTEWLWMIGVWPSCHRFPIWQLSEPKRQMLARHMHFYWIFRPCWMSRKEEHSMSWGLHQHRWSDLGGDLELNYCCSPTVDRR